MVWPYEYLNSFDDYQKLFENVKKHDFLSKLKNKYPSDENIKRLQQFIEVFDIKNEETLTRLYLKNDVFLLTFLFVEFKKVSIDEIDINLLYSVNLPGYTWRCALKYSEKILQTL